MQTNKLLFLIAGVYAIDKIINIISNEIFLPVHVEHASELLSREIAKREENCSTKNSKDQKA